MFGQLYPYHRGSLFTQELSEKIHMKLVNSDFYFVREDPYETRILRFLLIPGPSIDHSSIYTALKFAQHIHIWTDTTIEKTVITLDLDLYFRALQLVQPDDAMKKVCSKTWRTTCCIRALRAIGHFIENSCIDGASLSGS